jgi:hypothetical protein
MRILDYPRPGKLSDSVDTRAQAKIGSDAQSQSAKSSWFDVPVVKYVAITQGFTNKKMRRFRLHIFIVLPPHLTAFSWEFHSWFVQEAGKVAHSMQTTGNFRVVR